MAYQFAAVASAVDCPAFVRAVAILSSTYIGFFWFLLIVEAAIKGKLRVFFIPLAIRSESGIAFSSLLTSVIVQDSSRFSR